MKILVNVLSIAALVVLGMLVGCKNNRNKNKNNLSTYFSPTSNIGGLNYSVVESRTSVNGNTNSTTGASGNAGTGVGVGVGVGAGAGSNGANGGAANAGNNAPEIYIPPKPKYVPQYNSAFNTNLNTNNIITCLRENLESITEDNKKDEIQQKNEGSLLQCLKETLGSKICGKKSGPQNATLKNYGEDVQKSLNLVKALKTMSLHQQLVMHKQALEEIPVEVAKEVIQEKLGGEDSSAIVLPKDSKEALDVLLNKYKALNDVRDALSAAEASLEGQEGSGTIKKELNNALDAYNKQNKATEKALKKLKKNFPENPMLNNQTPVFLQELTIEGWLVEGQKVTAETADNTNKGIVKNLQTAYENQVTSLTKLLDQYLSHRGNTDITTEEDTSGDKVSVKDILEDKPLELANKVITATGWPFNASMKVKLFDLVFEDGKGLSKDEFYKALIEKVKKDKENNPKLASAAEFIAKLNKEENKLNTLDELKKYFNEENQSSAESVKDIVNNINLTKAQQSRAPYQKYVNSTCSGIRTELSKINPKDPQIKKLTQPCDLAKLYEVSLADPKYFNGLVDETRNLLSIPPREFNEENVEEDPVDYDILIMALDNAHQKLKNTDQKEKFIETICETEDDVTGAENPPPNPAVDTSSDKNILKKNPKEQNNGAGVAEPAAGAEL